jgi:HSP20 family protein
MTVLIEPFPPWLRDAHRFVDRETQVSQFIPPADVLVTDDGVTVHMDIPGVAADRVEVELDNDVLTVRGERPYPYGDKPGAVQRIERGFGRFERTLRVPRGLDPETIEASMTNGVLTLKLPKPETPTPRKIEIASST